jgi:hypothetical protein
VSDLLEDEGMLDTARDLGKSVDEPPKVPVAVPLERFLERVRVEGEGVGVDVGDGALDVFDPVAAIELRDAEVPPTGPRA